MSLQWLYTEFVEEKRAKIALIELIAIKFPDKAIIKLLTISASYLSNPFVADWIVEQRQLTYSENDSKKNASRENIKSIQSWLMPPLRGSNTRKGGTWFNLYAYNRLMRAIKIIRKLKARGRPYKLQWTPV